MRLQALHREKLLSDGEFEGMEDLCADFLELRASSTAVLTAEVRSRFHPQTPCCQPAASYSMVLTHAGNIHESLVLYCGGLN